LVKILPIDESIVDIALSSKFNDFEDGLQYYAAKEQSLFGIITRNIRSAASLAPSHASLQHILPAMVAYLWYNASQSPYPRRHRTLSLQHRMQPEQWGKILGWTAILVLKNRGK
jgi:hypothetical protein